MFKKLLSQILAAGLGLWLSSILIKGIVVQVLPDSNFFGIELTSQWQIFVVLGVVLGLLNYYLKPLLKILSLPLEIITLGLFTIIINIALIWMLDKMFDELYIPWLMPLVSTTVIIWALNLLTSKILINKKEED